MTTEKTNSLCGQNGRTTCSTSTDLGVHLSSPLPLSTRYSIKNYRNETAVVTFIHPTSITPLVTLKGASFDSCRAWYQSTTTIATNNLPLPTSTEILSRNKIKSSLQTPQICQHRQRKNRSPDSGPYHGARRPLTRNPTSNSRHHARPTTQRTTHSGGPLWSTTAATPSRTTVCSTNPSPLPPTPPAPIPALSPFPA